MEIMMQEVDVRDFQLLFEAETFFKYAKAMKAIGQNSST
jgi:hypothetical protein